MLPRQEWIAFIPGAHPGYITLDQYEANLATLAANAAAHGPDRAAGPAREGPALLQGSIVCGRWYEQGRYFPAVAQSTYRFLYR